ncbi:MAG: BrnT family toxin [Treponema sp.]|jgi:uncharacterized DUF497 family protein|nr:BrnT family toxin [Treponema sp.]
MKPEKTTVWDMAEHINTKQDVAGILEAAQYVFFYFVRLERFDRSEGNTSGEERMQTLGMVGKVLFVVYTERGENKRIISARLADKSERRSYNGYYQIDGKGWAKNT